MGSIKKRQNSTTRISRILSGLKLEIWKPPTGEETNSWALIKKHNEMIHKTTDDKIKELRECIERTEGYKQRLLDTNSIREAALIGIKVSQLKNELKGSYTESTPLWEVQGLIRNELDTIHEKALAIQRELCRIYKEEECLHVKCYGCPLCIVDSNGSDDKCFKALKQHFVCQYLTTEFHV